MKEVKKVKFADLKFEEHNILGGIQARFENYSVIQGDFAYTDGDTYEVGILKDEKWDVEGHCDEARVEEILNGSPLSEIKATIEDAFGSLKEFKDLEYKIAKGKAKLKKWYIGVQIFHGLLAAWYLYLAIFTDYMANPAIVALWIGIVVMKTYFENKTLN